jgi:hypothetical protein
MTHPPAHRPQESDSELLEPNGTIPFIPPTRGFPGVIRSWRPNLSETTRKAHVRSSLLSEPERVREEYRRHLVGPKGDQAARLIRWPS